MKKSENTHDNARGRNLIIKDRRSRIERRQSSYTYYIPEKRNGNNRRKKFERRNGIERRDGFDRRKGNH